MSDVAIISCGSYDENEVLAAVERGVSLLGVDSGYIREPYRHEVWQRLAGDLRPQHLAAMARRIRFADLPAAFDEYIAGRAKGRLVVEICGE